MTNEKRPTKETLNRLFVEGLGEHVKRHDDLNEKPLLIDLKPRDIKLRVYLWNCTNPPGGRPPLEYKIQLTLPGQKKSGKSGHLDYSDGRMPIVGGVLQDDDDLVFIFWDADKHKDFAFSSNVQVTAQAIIEAECKPISETVKTNGEHVICSRQQYVYDAIIRRMDIMHENLLGELK